jgi:tetratricopeptide (TPR) repeat protein
MGVLDRDPRGGPESRLWAADVERGQEPERLDRRRRVKIMRRLFSWKLSALLLVAMAAGAHADNSNQSSQSPSNPPGDSTTPPGASATAATPATSTPSVTVTGKVPRNEPTLPKLAPDQFTECYATNSTAGPGTMDWAGIVICQSQLKRDTRIVIDKCINRDGKSAPPMIVQACTELLDRKILEGHERFYLFVNRAVAYVAQVDKQHALDDYNTAVKLAPKYAQPYYYRGVFYAAQTDVDAALRDFDTALSINPKLVPALRQRAITYLTQKDFSGALADFSEALRLQPKTAALWSERGYVCMLLRDYASAVKDEAEAIRLDPKLARAYFIRGAAFGDLGDSQHALSDIVTAVDLDPSLDRYISSKGKTASITLPPL